ncbi:helix-turn-helix transcriptional regulator [Streptomyces sp. NPDC005728]|uniref:helix-turn-helix domain-containing protein n=1 Tax=Streptomyces sp. NPDC005728 TaxID=3157054 RepID=UPI0033E52DE4
MCCYQRRGGRTLAAIAGLCGITERYLEMIEAGRKVPSADVLARLAAELDVPLAALFAEGPAGEPAADVSTRQTVPGFGTAWQAQRSANRRPVPCRSVDVPLPPTPDRGSE